jgi:phosphatidylserine/phosphatidylglycerophosphate/cardiolipin synthase-like enzyme
MADDSKAPDANFSTPEVASLATVAVLLYVALAVGPIATLVAANARPHDCPVVRVYFSPRGGCEEAIVAAIDDAKATIRVQAYSFTSRPVEAALAKAKGRGVDVRVALDDSNRNPATSQADELAAAGVLVLLDGSHPIAHSKTLVIDEHIVITGSYNLSAAARSNLENLLVIDDKATAGRYAENWDLHVAHCRPMGP